MYKSTSDLEGEIVEILMPFTVIEKFETYLKSIDEHCDEGSIIVQEAHIYIEPDEKKLRKVIMVGEILMLIERWLDINVDIVIHQENEKIVFLVVFCIFV